MHFEDLWNEVEKETKEREESVDLDAILEKLKNDVDNLRRSDTIEQKKWFLGEILYMICSYCKNQEDKQILLNSYQCLFEAKTRHEK